jgi:hypothetical protein
VAYCPPPWAIDGCDVLAATELEPPIPMEEIEHVEDCRLQNEKREEVREMVTGQMILAAWIVKNTDPCRVCAWCSFQSLVRVA